MSPRPSAGCVKKRRRRRSLLERLESRQVLASVSGLVTSDLTFNDPADPVFFDGDTTIAPGVTVEIGPNVAATLNENFNIEVNGRLRFREAASFTVEDGFSGQTSGVVVNDFGTLEVINTDFVRLATGNLDDFTRIQVNAGGTFQASDSRFDLDGLFLDDGSLIEDLSGSFLADNEFTQTITVPYTHLLDPASLGGNRRFSDIQILGDTLPGGTQLDLSLIGTATTADLRYVLPEGFHVGQGATMDVDPNVDLLLKENQKLLVDGTLRFDNAGTVIIEDGFSGQTSGICVSGTGTLDIINTDFVTIATGNLSDHTLIDIAAGGTFKASDSEFDWDELRLADGSVIRDVTESFVEGNAFPLTVTLPFEHLQNPSTLSNNLLFEDVNLLSGTLPDGATQDLRLMGTATTEDLRYVFPAGFTIQDQARLTVQPNVPVLIKENQEIRVDGVLQLDNADPVIIEDGFSGETSGIRVTGGGTLDVINTDFERVATGNLSDRSRIRIDAGATLKAVDSRFDWDAIELDNGSLVRDAAGTFVSRNEFALELTLPFEHLQDSARLADNLLFEDVNLLAGSLPAGESLDLRLIGTATTEPLRFIFPSGFSVQENATLTVHEDTPVLIRENQQIDVDGLLRFDSADPLEIEDGFSGETSGIQVNGTGTLELINTDLTRVGTGNLADNARILVNAGGKFIASDSRLDWDAVVLADGSVIRDGGNPTLLRNEFALPVTLPHTHLQQPDLLSSNRLFEDIFVLGDTLVSGESVRLDLIGTSTTDALRFVFPDGFNIGEGSAMFVSEAVSVLLKENQQFIVDGNLRFDDAAPLVIEDGFSGQTSGITVGVNGRLDVVNTDFVRINTGNLSDVSRLLVDGVLNMERSRFAWDRLILDASASSQLERNDFDTQIIVDGAADTHARINDFSDLATGNAGMQAIGNPLAEIDFRWNFWGTTDPQAIDEKILHKPDDEARPLVAFMPALVSPRPGEGAIRGLKFHDLNDNGVRDEGEPGLGGVRVYVDQNGNEAYDRGEPFAITAADDPATTSVDETGRYEIRDLIEGTHTVREVVPSGFTQTFPLADAVSRVVEFDAEGAEPGVTEPGTQTFAFGGATFSGGTVLNPGDTALTASALFAYELTETGPAMVRFDRPIDSATFFFVHASGSPFTATAYGLDGSIVGQVSSLAATTAGDPANFVTLDASAAISRLEFDGGVIDDFQFTTLANQPAHVVHLGDDDVIGQIDFGNHRATPTLVVTRFIANQNGFEAHFNRPIDPDELNLYDVAAGTFGEADVEVVGDTVGRVNGSLILSDTGDSVTFVKTGGPLEPDTYSVRLRSAADGFFDAGGLLDGNGDETAGDDLLRRFEIATPTADVVTLSVTDFVRGAGQMIHLPRNDDGGIPIVLSRADDVTSVDFEMTFDPSLVQVDGFVSRIPGSASQFQLVEPGRVRVTLSSPNAFSVSEDATEIGYFSAGVPETATYGSKQVLDLTVIEVRNAAPIPAARPARDDDGVHVAAYVGDTNASHSYTGGDVTLLQRKIVGSDSGFEAYPLLDPSVLADINHSESLTGGDATLLQRVIVGTPIDLVPPIPSDVTPLSSAGPDPLLFIPTDLAGSPSTTVVTPVMLTVTEAAGITVSSVDLVIEYDPQAFSVGETRLGSLLDAAGFTAPVVNVESPGVIRVTMSTATGTAVLPMGTTGAVLEFDLSVSAAASVGGSAINLRASFTDSISRTITNVTDRSIDELTLVPAPTDADNDSVDGLITVMPGVQSIEINEGSDSRSNVTSLTVRFNTVLDETDLDNAIALINTTTATPVEQIHVDAGVEEGKTVALLTFSGASTVERPSGGNSLADGAYRLDIDADLIAAPPLGQMTEDAVFGESSVDALFRFYGDDDGDRDVDGLDYLQLAQTFLRTSADATFNAAFDSDGDGDVDGLDYTRFATNFQRRLDNG